MSATAESAAPAPFPVSASRLQPAGHSWRVWNVVVPSGVTPEQLCAPLFWRCCASQLQPLDRIECVPDDAAFYAELLVISANPADGAIVRPLRGVDLQGAAPRGASARNPTGARVEYKGPHLKWCVLRGDEVLKDQLATEAQANQWLASWAHTTRANP